MDLGGDVAEGIVDGFLGLWCTYQTGEDAEVLSERQFFPAEACSEY